MGADDRPAAQPRPVRSWSTRLATQALRQTGQVYRGLFGQNGFEFWRLLLQLASGIDRESAGTNSSVFQGNGDLSRMARPGPRLAMGGGRGTMQFRQEIWLQLRPGNHTRADMIETSTAGVHQMRLLHRHLLFH